MGDVPTHQPFSQANTQTGRVKTVLRGTYHTLRLKYRKRHLSAFRHRFDHHLNLVALGAPLIVAAVHGTARLSPHNRERVML